MSDIMLDSNFQLEQSAFGGAQIIDGVTLLLQEIRLEAVTQPGDLFYDEAYGWGLQEFSHRQADELTLFEIEQRITRKLSQRLDVDVKKVSVSFTKNDDVIVASVRFCFLGSDELHEIDLSIGRVQIEVIRLD